MEKLTEVLAMGGYGAYVWPAFAVACIVLCTMVACSRRSYHQAQRALTELQAHSSHEA